LVEPANGLHSRSRTAAALASAGWGTDEDYGAHEVEIYEY
jgi:hypothetical protein